MQGLRNVISLIFRFFVMLQMEKHLVSQRDLGLQGSGLKCARLQGSRTKISGFQGSIAFHLGFGASL